MHATMAPASNFFDAPGLPGNHGTRLKNAIKGRWGVMGPTPPRTQRTDSTAGAMVKLLKFRARKTLNIEDLYRRYGGTVARRVRRFVPPCDVEEVVHEVFLKAMEREASFRGDASPVTWLYHIATNHCLNRIRDHKRRQELLFENRELPWILPADAPDTESTVFLEQLWSQLDDTLTMVGIYYFVDGLTHEEIARITGTSRRTVGNRIEALKAQAKALLGDAS